jgi:acetyl-CoA carboxylase biotin carboxyl carrier protein
MTTSEAAGFSGPVEPFGPADAADVLKRLQDSVLGLLAGLDRAPRLLRIKADQVELEVEWPVEGRVVDAADLAALTAAPASIAPAAAPGPAAAAEPAGHYVTAHMVGVFYRSPQPGAEPFVEADEVILRGQQVGIIEAMKLMIPVEAEVAGRIVEVLVSDGAAVEYGDRLFAVEPAGS